jgi:hypothetical protein
MKSLEETMMHAVEQNCKTPCSNWHVHALAGVTLQVYTNRKPWIEPKPRQYMKSPDFLHAYPGCNPLLHKYIFR